MKERYEQEIEQLLSELDSEPADPAKAPPPNDSGRPLDDEPSPFAPKPKENVRLISPSKLALAGAILAVIGFLPLLPVWTSLAGLATMAVAAVWMFIRRMGSQPATYWRGRPVDEPPQGAWQRFRNWLSK